MLINNIRAVQLLVGLLFLVGCKGLKNDPEEVYLTINDKGFEEILIENGSDSKGVLDGKILRSDALLITHLTIKQSLNLKSVEDIRYLENLTFLNILYTPMSNAFDLSSNSKIDTLYIFSPNLEELNLKENVNLKYLNIRESGLKTIDLEFNTKLSHLEIRNSPLSSLIAGESVKFIVCSFTRVKKLDTSKAWGLYYLDCNNSYLESLDLSKNPALDYVDCTYNYITKLDLPREFCQDLRIRELHMEFNSSLGKVCVCDKEQAYINTIKRLYIPFYKWDFGWTKDELTYFEKCVD